MNQLQPAQETLAPESAFNNVQQVVRKCKDPALSMEQGDVLRESLEVIAKQIMLARDLAPRVAELETQIATLTAEKEELEKKAATAAIPPGFVLVPAAQAANVAPAAAAAAAPSAPAISLVSPAPAPVLGLAGANGPAS